MTKLATLGFLVRVEERCSIIDIIKTLYSHCFGRGKFQSTIKVPSLIKLHGQKEGRKFSIKEHTTLTTTKIELEATN